MTRALVVDASAVLAMLLSQTGGPAVRDTLAEGRRSSRRVLVPAHFWLEVTNSMLRRHRVAARLVLAAIHRLDEFDLESIEVGRPQLLLALDLAERHELSLYEAAYLALAQAEDATLLTADRKLLVAGGDRAHPVGDARRLSDVSLPYGKSPTWPEYRHVSALLADLRRSTVMAPASSRDTERGMPR